MKKTTRSFMFEVKKTLFEYRRSLLFLLVFIILVILLYWVVFYWFSFNQPIPSQNEWWDNTLKDHYLEMIANTKNTIQICTGELEPEPGVIFSCPADINQLYFQIERYEAIIKYKLYRYEDSFSTGIGYISQRQDMLAFQTLVYLFFPYVIAFNLYIVLAHEYSFGYHKNYVNLSVDQKSLRRGKIIYSIVMLFAMYVVLNLLGLYFYRDAQLLVYDGIEYYVISYGALYATRAFEMLIGLSFFYVLFLVIVKYCRNNAVLTISLSLLFASFFLPLAFSLKGEAEGTTVFTDIINKIPLYNMVSSSGFQDGNALYRLGIPLLGIGLLIVIYCSGNILHKVFKKVDRNFSNTITSDKI